MLTEQEVKNLEQQAELTRRRNAALDSMKSDQTSRLQRRYNDARAASDNDAHARFMERRRQFAERNPYTVTPDERRRFQALSDRADLREHEMAMLTRRNQGALDIAQVNAEGLRNQGAVAAGIKAEADKRVAELGLEGTRIQADTNRLISDATLTSQERIAAEKNKLDREIAEITGNVQLGVAATNAKTKAAGDRLASETALKAEGIKRDATIRAAEEKTKGDIAAAESRLLERDRNRAISFKTKMDTNPHAVLSNGKSWSNMTPDERAAYALENGIDLSLI